VHAGSVVERHLAHVSVTGLQSHVKTIHCNDNGFHRQAIQITSSCGEFAKQDQPDCGIGETKQTKKWSLSKVRHQSRCTILKSPRNGDTKFMHFLLLAE